MVRRKRTSKKKKSSAGTMLAVLLVLVLAAGGAAWLVVTPFGPPKETFVEIAPGSTTFRIGRQLEAAGVVRNQYAFAAVRWLRRGTLKAGEYRFDHPAPMTEVYARIVRGDVYTRALTIPEGYNIFDIAQAVESAGLGSREAFLAAARQHTELIAEWTQPGAPPPASLEGFLFPDTYRFSR